MSKAIVVIFYLTSTTQGHWWGHTTSHPGSEPQSSLGSQPDPTWMEPGRSDPIQVWMLLERSPSSDIWVRRHHLPPTHNCKSNSKPAQDYRFSSHSQKIATVPLPTTEPPKLTLSWCTHTTFATGRLQAPWAGSINHSLYKKSPNLQSPENWAGASNFSPAGAQGKSELSLLK